MIGNYLKVSLRNLIRHKTFSLINILGFAFGISICLLIILFLIKEYSYDRFNTHADHIYRLIDADENSSAIDYRVAARLRNNYPEVKNACVAYVIPDKYTISINKTGYTVDGIMSVDHAFFEMFDTRFVYGNPDNPLPNPNSVVLTMSSARKIFGSENPIGKEIELMRNFSLIVTGVIEDFPENSSISANMIVNMENKNFKFFFSCANGSDSSTFRYPFNIYLLLENHANPSQLITKLNSHPETMQPYMKKAALLALKDTYLYDNTTGGTTKKGNLSLLKLFSGIAFVVLLLAVINYINLSVAQQNKRSKEIGIRKTIGAGRGNIIILFLTESLLVACTAVAIGLVITEILLSIFSTMVDTRLSLQPLIQFPGIIVLMFAILVIGIASGIVPALLFSSFNPVKALSGKVIALGNKNHFQDFLTVFQFTISIALIFCIIVIQRQITYAKDDNLGFEKEQLLYINLPFADGGSGRVVMNKLKECPSVINVTTSNGVPGEVHMHMGPGVKGMEKSLACLMADTNFLATLQIELIKGRMPFPGEYGQVCLFNQTAYNYFGWDNLEGKRYNNGREGGFAVIGVVKDFHTASMHKPIEPTCIMFTSQYSLSNISVRMEKGSTAQTMAYESS
jgi:putative ABC transport system permease protein